ncbi:Uncharacterized protein OBRU01_14464 [Operophtera brumata]|uniref:C2H2-type domain-containing protein n=1 Tax=Operophtera brumata TaxID=104452 RepID=A0A0L7L6A7_OPEBR|nr:Uncharacterized protein OBRU01_14464 [Operophtera brumata]
MTLMELLDLPADILEECKQYAVGHRKLDDVLFQDDKPPPRLGVYDLDDENLCHEVIKTTCSVPGCIFTAESLLDFESHYNSSHRYVCATCKKGLPSPHLLDLHIQENHDSFFAVMAEKKHSYSCYIEECKEKFKTAADRMDHCVKTHKLPKDFRFEINPKKPKSRKKTKVQKNNESESMDSENTKQVKNPFMLFNSKSKAFPKYTGRKFTKNNESIISKDIDMDVIIDDLKESLPK